MSFDLDNDELKATRIMNGSLELSADDMFKELGYSKNEDKRTIIYNYIQYFNHFKVHKIIYFHKLDKQIVFRSYNLTDDIKTDFNLTVKELQAINKKCKELGWI